jgi:hypothetical protein
MFECPCLVEFMNLLAIHLRNERHFLELSLIGFLFIQAFFQMHNRYRRIPRALSASTYTSYQMTITYLDVYIFVVFSHSITIVTRIVHFKS